MDDRTWTALVDPHRRAVLDLLLQGECSVGDLVERLGLTQPQTSKHLRVLREAGVVTVQIDGPRRVYSLASRPLGDVHAWLEPYRRMWTESFDALERHLDNGPKEPDQKQEDAP